MSFCICGYVSITEEYLKVILFRSYTSYALDLGTAGGGGYTNISFVPGEGLGEKLLYKYTVILIHISAISIVPIIVRLDCKDNCIINCCKVLLKCWT